MNAVFEVRRRAWHAASGELVDDRVWEVRCALREMIDLAEYGLLTVSAVSTESVCLVASGQLDLRAEPELPLGGRATVRVQGAAVDTPHWELRVIALREVDARTLPGGTPLERDLLAAISAAPEEDAPRLVYADWLMLEASEADRDRGELMLTQIALGMLIDNDRRAAMRARERELIARLPPPVIAGDIALVWHRGFLERCTAETNAFARHVRELLLVAPLLSIVDLEYVTGAFDPSLARVEGIEQIREVSIVPRDATSRRILYNHAVATLVPSLLGLRRLRAPGMHVGLEGVQAIVASRACPQLTALDLSDNELAPTSLGALVDSPRLQPRVLRLAKCGFDPHDIERLARAPWLAEVEELELGDNVVDDRGAIALAAVPFRRLRRLALGSCGIGARGFTALVRSKHLARLVQLRIHQNAIGDAGAAALAESRLRSIATLDAQACDIGDAGIAALAASTSVRAARRWRLGGNRIGDAGARAILDSIHLRDLVELDLSRCAITDEDLLAALGKTA